MSAADAARWLAFAEDDLRAAELVLADEALAPRIACWHAQQAAEKAVKAVLVAQSVDFPFTHDLDALARLLPPGSRVAGSAADLAALSEWAVEARYPGDWPDVMRTEAQRAVADARLLMDGARSDLGAER